MQEDVEALILRQSEIGSRLAAPNRTTQGNDDDGTNNYSKQRALPRAPQTLKKAHGVFPQVSRRSRQSARRCAAAAVQDLRATPSGQWAMKALEKLRIPAFASTEQAIEWGSHLNAEQHSTLVQAQQAMSYTALAEPDLQLKVKIATQSQLMREAAAAFALTSSI
jgi:hypothetical protein